MHDGRWVAVQCFPGFDPDVAGEAYAIRRRNRRAVDYAKYLNRRLDRVSAVDYS